MKVKTEAATTAYLAGHIGGLGYDDIVAKDIAGGITNQLLDMVGVEPLTSAYVRGLCTRAKRAQPGVNLAYGFYLQAAATLLGYDSWRSAIRAKNKQDVIPHNFPVNDYVPKVREGTMVTRGPLAKLARGMHVHWAKLREILIQLSPRDMRVTIDALLLEMQMAVGVSNVTDPRGDMLFAIFRDPEDENGYIILGEKYRPPEERQGEYKTVQVKVKTYPMTNCIEKISIPYGDCYSPFSIKDLVAKVREFRVAA